MNWVYFICSQSGVVNVGCRHVLYDNQIFQAHQDYKWIRKMFVFVTNGSFVLANFISENFLNQHRTLFSYGNVFTRLHLLLFVTSNFVILRNIFSPNHSSNLIPRVASLHSGGIANVRGQNCLHVSLKLGIIENLKNSTNLLISIFLVSAEVWCY